MTSTPRLATRVLLVDPDDRVLLFHISLPDGRGLWLPPGGGIEADESPEQAAIREVQEETGLVLPFAGHRVWTRRTSFFDLDQSEEFFFVRLGADVVIDTDHNVDPIERDTLRGHRWWSVEEIAASDETFVPTHLSRELAPLLRGEFPPVPFDVGV